MDKVLTAIIVDDDTDCSLYLSNLIFSEFPSIRIVGIAKSVEEGLALIEKQKPEVLFLDINLPPYTGFDLLKQVKKRNFEVVFCTAHDDYAIQAFRMAAFDYLLKPIDSSLLGECVERLSTLKPKENAIESQMEIARDVYEKKNEKIIISSMDSFEIFDFNEIISIEAKGSYACFHTERENTAVSSKGLGYYTEILPKDIFFQCHKGYIVNLSAITKYIKGEGGSIITKDGKEIPVAARKKEQLMLLLKNNSLI